MFGNCLDEVAAVLVLGRLPIRLAHDDPLVVAVIIPVDRFGQRQGFFGVVDDDPGLATALAGVTGLGGGRSDPRRRGGRKGALTVGDAPVDVKLAEVIAAARCWLLWLLEA